MTKSTKRSKLKRARTSAYYKKDWKTFWEIINLLRRKKVVMQTTPFGNENNLLFRQYHHFVLNPPAIIAVVSVK